MDNEKPKKKKTAAKKKAAEGKETRAHKAPWQETTATVDDIMRFLDDRVMLRYNTVTRRVECHIVRNYKLRSPAEYEPLTDRMVNSLWAEMAQTQEKTGRELNELKSAVTMALQMIGGNIVHSLSKEKIGHAFAKLGFEYRRKPSMRGYIAIHRTGVEMEAYRRKLAEKETGMTDDSMTANS